MKEAKDMARARDVQTVIYTVIYTVIHTVNYSYAYSYIHTYIHRYIQLHTYIDTDAWHNIQKHNCLHLLYINNTSVNPTDSTG